MQRASTSLPLTSINVWIPFIAALLCHALDWYRITVDSAASHVRSRSPSSRSACRRRLDRIAAIEERIENGPTGRCRATQVPGNRNCFRLAAMKGDAKNEPNKQVFHNAWIVPLFARYIFDLFIFLRSG